MVAHPQALSDVRLCLGIKAPRIQGFASLNTKRIIIIGGGFAGVKCAAQLSRELSGHEAEIILFDRQNHLVFSPLLAEVVGSSLNPLDIVVPLRQMLSAVLCRNEEVRSIDLAGNQVEYEAEDGQCMRIGYDHLVIACGNVTNLNVVPGMADHAYPLKTVADANALRSQLMAQMERAEVATDPERRAWHLTVLVVGGGYSGVEAAGEINDLLRASSRYFRHWRAEDVRVMLVHSRDQILPEISPPLREFARRKMEKAGVQMVLNARANLVSSEGVGFEDGRFLRVGTIVCTIGSSPSPLIQNLDCPKEKARLLTEPDLRLKGLPNVWAIGDCAWILNQLNGEPSPTTGQFAEREGTQCARNICRALQDQPTVAFRFKLIGELCSIGGHSAVADLMGMHLSGFLAWFVWRGVYLFKLPTIGRRVQVGFDWATLLLFPRDLAFIRADTTERVSHAHYDTGEFIIRKGDAPTSFYVVKQGEVEVLRPQDNGATEVVAVLAPGAFFGERALIGNRPRAMSVRARTPVDILVMGRNVFNQLSTALAPFREALAQTLNRRAADPWKDRPAVYERLRQTPVSKLMEPIPTPLLSPAAATRDVGSAFVDHANEFFYASSDGQTLEGVVTITDLIRAGSRNGSDAKALSDIMTRNPVTICPEDDCAVAANVIREYRLKSIPVTAEKNSRKLVGCLRLRRLLAFALAGSDPGTV